MPDAARDGKHAFGVAKGTKAQQQNPSKGDPRDNKHATDKGHTGKHRKD